MDHRPPPTIRFFPDFPRRSGNLQCGLPMRRDMIAQQSRMLQEANGVHQAEPGSECPCQFRGPAHCAVESAEPS